MTNRYTEKALERDVARWNQQLAEINHANRLHVAPRNGYCAIDETIPGTSAVNYLESGTPRECRAAGALYVSRAHRAHEAAAMSGVEPSPIGAARSFFTQTIRATRMELVEIRAEFTDYANDMANHASDRQTAKELARFVSAQIRKF